MLSAYMLQYFQSFPILFEKRLLTSYTLRKSFMKKEAYPMAVAFALTMAEDRILRGDLFRAEEGKKGTLIVCHGYKGFKDWGFFPYIGQKLSQKFDVITFNFSHNGVGDNLLDFTELEKFAGNTYSRELEDLDFLICALHDGRVTGVTQVAEKPLFLLGHSRGAGVSLLYAFDHPGEIAGVVSWNGITDVDLFTAEEKEDMRTKGRAYVRNARTNQQMPLDVEILQDLERNRDRFAILQRVKDADVPIVLIQGTDDGKRLQEGSARLTEIRPDIPWLRVAGGNHTFCAGHPFQGTTEPLEEAIRLTEAWLVERTEA
jgi:pimeloyl-ACP methyl ester carboxylesterase